MYFETALNEREKMELNKYKKVIIWGFPLHTHTHSYIHSMWAKVFSVGFGKKTYWFHDTHFPPIEGDTYENAIFITEGYADNNIPINNTSVYFVHNAINPEKYIYKHARLIEIRFNVIEIHDVNNNFNLTDGTHENIVFLSPETKYEKLDSNKDLHIGIRGEKIKKMNYECVYLYWATDLLPHEFNYDIQTEITKNVINYIASPCNSINYNIFKKKCISNNIIWNHIDPWRTPISFEKNIQLMKQSILCPDFRPIGTNQDIQKFGIKNGKNHLEIGYLPCRVLKAISYGKIGITDSIHVKNILKEHVIYDKNMEVLFEIAIRERNNYEKIVSAMKYIEENHTYVQRARDLIRALMC
jgi:hypothetical protein